MHGIQEPKEKGGRQELESEWRECKCNEYESAFAGVFILGWFVSGCMLAARKRKVHKTRRVEYKYYVEEEKKKGNYITGFSGAITKTVLLYSNYNQILMQMNSVIKGQQTSSSSRVEYVFIQRP